MAGSTASAGATIPSTPAPRLRREWRRGLRSLWRFITTPSDLGNSFEAMFALAGPLVEREFRDFAAHPVGARLLADHLLGTLAERPGLHLFLTHDSLLAPTVARLWDGYAALLAD